MEANRPKDVEAQLRVNIRVALFKILKIMVLGLQGGNLLCQDLESMNQTDTIKQTGIYDKPIRAF
jgi:hypothetical protein